MKINKQGIYILGEEAIEKITQLVTPQKYSVQSDLFYEGQIPIVAYLLIDGQINLMKNKRIRGTLDRGSLIGLKELMNHIPAKLRAQICPNTSVCYLDRSTVLEIIESHIDEDLSSLFKEMADHQAS